jgi:hypothetical protein
MNKTTKHTKAELENLKDYAKILFTRDRLTLQEIGLKTGIVEATLTRWMHNGGWIKLQRNFILTREEQMDNLLDELVQINNSIRNKPDGEQFADAKLSDVRRKLILDITDLETKNASVPETLAVFKNLLEYVRKVDLAKSQEIARWMDEYVRAKL